MLYACDAISYYYYYTTQMASFETKRWLYDCFVLAMLLVKWDTQQDRVLGDRQTDDGCCIYVSCLKVYP